jgi:hypothetical protein
MVAYRHGAMTPLKPVSGRLSEIKELEALEDAGGDRHRTGGARKPTIPLKLGTSRFESDLPPTVAAPAGLSIGETGIADERPESGETSRSPGGTTRKQE